jgi:hypothetical protein
MIKIIFLVLLMQIALIGTAQINPPDTCGYLNKYAGNWIYTNGNDTIRITLRLARYFDTDISRLNDKLFGWHEYKKGNNIIESDYQNRFMNLSNADTIVHLSTSIGFFSYKYCNPAYADSLSGHIIDYNQSNECKIVNASYLSNGNLKWRQRHMTGFGQWTGAYGMTLPKEFILVKQP